MKKNCPKIGLLICIILTFCINCSKKTEENKDVLTRTLEYSIGDLLAKTLIISGENTVWIFEYNRFPVVILDDIEKDGFNYILVLKNGLTGERTKVSVKKGTILDIKESIPLDMDLFGTYEAIMGARGHIPVQLKVKDVSKTKLVVEEIRNKE